MDFTPSAPEQEQVSLTFVDLGGPSGLELKEWTQYEYASNIELPADGWSFTIGAESLPNGLEPLDLPGKKVALKVNGLVQGTGYVDRVDIRASRGAGTEFNIQGRDLIAQVVDACADPTHTFKEGMTLEDVLVELFAPFGWDREDHFIVDNQANALAKAGIRGTPHTKKGKPLKRFVLHQLRPYPREGVFQFASRIAQRHGLMIWMTASGNNIVVSTPNFETDPFYQIRRNATGTTNVLDGSVTFNVMNQPTCIVADGASGGGEFGRGRIKSIMANTAVLTEDEAFLEPYKRYPDAHRVLGYDFPNPLFLPRARPLFLHDEESTTQEQLDNFVRREMARLQRETVVANYTVEGHGQNTEEDGFVPWTVDSVVDVRDEIAGLNERMYVLGRTFHKSRQGGTTTSLQLIRLNTIVLGEPASPKPAPAAATDDEIVRLREELEIEGVVEQSN